MTIWQRIQTWLAETRTPTTVALRRPWPTTRRGRKLWLVALLTLVRGATYVRGAASDTVRTALTPVTTFIPLQVFGWLVIALMAWVAWLSYCHRGRDRLGYTVLVGYYSGWIVLYLGAHWFGGASTDVIGGAVIYAAVVAILLECAGDPPDDHGHGGSRCSL